MVFEKLSCLIDAISAMEAPEDSSSRPNSHYQHHPNFNYPCYKDEEGNLSVNSVSSMSSMSTCGGGEDMLCSYGFTNSHHHHNHHGHGHGHDGEEGEGLGGDGYVDSAPRVKIPRKRISMEQTEVLQTLFESGVHFPTREIREKLSKQLSLSARTIQVWFQNRRQAARNKIKGIEKASPNKKLAIRWMKPVIFQTSPFATIPSAIRSPSDDQWRTSPSELQYGGGLEKEAASSDRA